MTNFELLNSLDETEMAIFLSVDSECMYANDWYEGIMKIKSVLESEATISKEDFEKVKNTLKNNIEFLKANSEFDKEEDFEKVKDMFNLN